MNYIQCEIRNGCLVDVTWLPDKQIFCNTRKGVVNLYLDFN